MSKYLVCSVIAGLALAGCMAEAGEDVGSTSAAATIRDCDVDGAGSFPSGDVFEGSLSDVAGTESIDWKHNGPLFSFETITLDGADDIVCRQNGRITATVLTTGDATVDGVSGFGYYLYMEDNRPAPSGGGPILLSASRSTRPTRWVDGEQTFSSPTDVTVPEQITVTTGDPARGFAFLYLGDLRCKYRGDGENFIFDKCPADESVAPGDTLTVGSARLHIQNGSCDLLEAAVDIGTELVPAPGTPDYYQLVVLNGDGTEYDRFAGSLVDGDIAVNLH